jgi:hypothetical protein
MAIEAARQFMHRCELCASDVRSCQLVGSLVRPLLLALITCLLSFGWLPATARASTDCIAYASGIAWGKVSINSLTEASGVAASRRNPGVLWVHNDGSRQTLYAISTNGARLATYSFNIKVDDTEDIAIGPGPTNNAYYVYLGDIGGSKGENGVRNEVKIVRWLEPAIDGAWENDPLSYDLDNAESFTLQYPDGSYDAESLMVDPLSGLLFVLTKQDGVARIYYADVTGLANLASKTLTYGGELAFNVASGADISPDGTRIVVRREDYALMWTRQPHESVLTALKQAGQSVPLIGPPTEPNGEGIGFLADGTGYVTISEGESPQLYFFPSLCPAAPQFILSLSNATGFLGGNLTFSAVAAGYPPPSFNWLHNGQTLAGQVESKLFLTNLTAGDAGVYSVIASNASGWATNTATLEVIDKPKLYITEVMASEANKPSVSTADWWELTSFESQTVSLSGWRFSDADSGWSGAFILPSELAIAPGESILFVQDLTANEFAKWWGASNLPSGLQIITYTGQGLKARGDSLILWNDHSTSNAPIVSVSFTNPTVGVSLNCNPLTGALIGDSQLGVNGVIRAVSSADLGNPGRILAPAVAPQLIVLPTNGAVRIGFQAALGRKYSLDVCQDLSSLEWDPTGDVYYATNISRTYFEKSSATGNRFYRVRCQ